MILQDEQDFTSVSAWRGSWSRLVWERAARVQPVAPAAHQIPEADPPSAVARELLPENSPQPSRVNERQSRPVSFSLSPAQPSPLLCRVAIVAVQKDYWPHH